MSTQKQTDQELVEKYAREIRNSGVPPLTKDAYAAILTRLLFEVRRDAVDVERVWGELTFNKYVERLACPDCHDVDTEQDEDGWRCRGCSHKFKHHKIIIWLSKDELAAAIKAAGGGK